MANKKKVPKRVFRKRKGPRNRYTRCEDPDVKKKDEEKRTMSKTCNLDQETTGKSEDTDFNIFDNIFEEDVEGEVVFKEDSEEKIDKNVNSEFLCSNLKKRIFSKVDKKIRTDDVFNKKSRRLCNKVSQQINQPIKKEIENETLLSNDFIEKLKAGQGSQRMLASQGSQLPFSNSKTFSFQPNKEHNEDKIYESIMQKLETERQFQQPQKKKKKKKRSIFGLNNRFKLKISDGFEEKLSNEKNDQSINSKMSKLIPSYIKTISFEQIGDDILNELFQDNIVDQISQFAPSNLKTTNTQICKTLNFRQLNKENENKILFMNSSTRESEQLHRKPESQQICENELPQSVCSNSPNASYSHKEIEHEIILLPVIGTTKTTEQINKYNKTLRIAPAEKNLVREPAVEKDSQNLKTITSNKVRQKLQNSLALKLEKPKGKKSIQHICKNELSQIDDPNLKSISSSQKYKETENKIELMNANCLTESSNLLNKNKIAPVESFLEQATATISFPSIIENKHTMSNANLKAKKFHQIDKHFENDDLLNESNVEQLNTASEIQRIFKNTSRQPLSSSSTTTISLIDAETQHLEGSRAQETVEDKILLDHSTIIKSGSQKELQQKNQVSISNLSNFKNSSEELDIEDQITKVLDISKCVSRIETSNGNERATHINIECEPSSNSVHSNRKSNDSIEDIKMNNNKKNNRNCFINGFVDFIENDGHLCLSKPKETRRFMKRRQAHENIVDCKENSVLTNINSTIHKTKNPSEILFEQEPSVIMDIEVTEKQNNTTQKVFDRLAQYVQNKIHFVDINKLEKNISDNCINETSLAITKSKQDFIAIDNDPIKDLPKNDVDSNISYINKSAVEPQNIAIRESLLSEICTLQNTNQNITFRISDLNENKIESASKITHVERDPLLMMDTVKEDLNKQGNSTENLIDLFLISKNVAKAGNENSVEMQFHNQRSTSNKLNEITSSKSLKKRDVGEVQKIMHQWKDCISNKMKNIAEIAKPGIAFGNTEESIRRHTLQCNENCEANSTLSKINSTIYSIKSPSEIILDVELSMDVIDKQNNTPQSVFYRIDSENNKNAQNKLKENISDNYISDSNFERTEPKGDFMAITNEHIKDLPKNEENSISLDSNISNPSCDNRNTAESRTIATSESIVSAIFPLQNMNQNIIFKVNDLNKNKIEGTSKIAHIDLDPFDTMDVIEKELEEQKNTNENLLDLSDLNAYKISSGGTQLQNSCGASKNLTEIAFSEPLKSVIEYENQLKVGELNTNILNNMKNIVETTKSAVTFDTTEESLRTHTLESNENCRANSTIHNIKNSSEKLLDIEVSMDIKENQYNTTQTVFDRVDLASNNTNAQNTIHFVDINKLEENVSDNYISESSFERTEPKGNFMAITNDHIKDLPKNEENSISLDSNISNPSSDNRNIEQSTNQNIMFMVNDLNKNKIEGTSKITYIGHDSLDTMDIEKEDLEEQENATENLIDLSDLNAYKKNSDGTQFQNPCYASKHFTEIAFSEPLKSVIEYENQLKVGKLNTNISNNMENIAETTKSAIAFDITEENLRRRTLECNENCEENSTLSNINSIVHNKKNRSEIILDIEVSMDITENQNKTTQTVLDRVDLASNNTNAQNKIHFVDINKLEENVSDNYISESSFEIIEPKKDFMATNSEPIKDLLKTEGNIISVDSNISNPSSDNRSTAEPQTMATSESLVSAIFPLQSTNQNIMLKVNDLNKNKIEGTSKITYIGHDPLDTMDIEKEDLEEQENTTENLIDLSDLNAYKKNSDGTQIQNPCYASKHFTEIAFSEPLKSVIEYENQLKVGKLNTNISNNMENITETTKSAIAFDITEESLRRRTLECNENCEENSTLSNINSTVHNKKNRSEIILDIEVSMDIMEKQNNTIQNVFDRVDLAENNKSAQNKIHFVDINKLEENISENYLIESSFEITEPKDDFKSIINDPTKNIQKNEGNSISVDFNIHNPSTDNRSSVEPQTIAASEFPVSAIFPLESRNQNITFKTSDFNENKIESNSKPNRISESQQICENRLPQLVCSNVINTSSLHIKETKDKFILPSPISSNKICQQIDKNIKMLRITPAKKNFIKEPAVEKASQNLKTMNSNQVIGKLQNILALRVKKLEEKFQHICQDEPSKLVDPNLKSINSSQNYKETENEIEFNNSSIIENEASICDANLKTKNFPRNDKHFENDDLLNESIVEQLNTTSEFQRIFRNKSRQSLSSTLTTTSTPIDAETQDLESSRTQERFEDTILSGHSSILNSNLHVELQPKNLSQVSTSNLINSRNSTKELDIEDQITKILDVDKCVSRIEAINGDKLETHINIECEPSSNSVHSNRKSNDSIKHIKMNNNTKNNRNCFINGFVNFIENDGHLWSSEPLKFRRRRKAHVNIVDCKENSVLTNINSRIHNIKNTSEIIHMERESLVIDRNEQCPILNNLVEVKSSESVNKAICRETLNADIANKMKNIAEITKSAIAFGNTEESLKDHTVEHNENCEENSTLSNINSTVHNKKNRSEIILDIEVSMDITENQNNTTQTVFDRVELATNNTNAQNKIHLVDINKLKENISDNYISGSSFEIIEPKDDFIAITNEPIKDLPQIEMDSISVNSNISNLYADNRGTNEPHVIATSESLVSATFPLQSTNQNITFKISGLNENKIESTSKITHIERDRLVSIVKENFEEQDNSTKNFIDPSVLNKNKESSGVIQFQNQSSLSKHLTEIAFSEPLKSNIEKNIKGHRAECNKNDKVNNETHLVLDNIVTTHNIENMYSKKKYHEPEPVAFVNALEDCAVQNNILPSAEQFNSVANNRTAKNKIKLVNINQLKESNLDNYIIKNRSEIAEPEKDSVAVNHKLINEFIDYAIDAISIDKIKYHEPEPVVSFNSHEHVKVQNNIVPSVDRLNSAKKNIIVKNKIKLVDINKLKESSSDNYITESRSEIVEQENYIVTNNKLINEFIDNALDSISIEFKINDLKENKIGDNQFRNQCPMSNNLVEITPSELLKSVNESVMYMKNNAEIKKSAVQKPKQFMVDQSISDHIKPSKSFSEIQNQFKAMNKTKTNAWDYVGIVGEVKNPATIFEDVEENLTGHEIECNRNQNVSNQPNSVLFELEPETIVNVEENFQVNITQSSVNRLDAASNYINLSETHLTDSPALSNFCIQNQNTTLSNNKLVEIDLFKPSQTSKLFGETQPILIIDNTKTNFCNNIETPVKLRETKKRKGLDNNSTVHNKRIIIGNENITKIYKKQKFEVGDFIALEDELNCYKWPSIWEVITLTALKRYEPGFKNCQMIYKSTIKYSTFTQKIKTNCKKIPVTLQSTENGIITVLVLRHEIDFNYARSIKESFITYDELGGPFFNYIVTIVSQTLDFNFLANAFEGNNQDVTSKILFIDNLTERAVEKCKKIIKWDNNPKPFIEDLFNCKCMFPSESEKRISCFICLKLKAKNHLFLFGQPYNKCTLQFLNSVSLVDQHYFFCLNCSHNVILLHKLIHTKFLLYIECTKKVSQLKNSNNAMSNAEILSILMRDVIWLQELFSNFILNFAEVDFLEKLQ